MARQFGISTHLFHDVRLAREHLTEIALAGFDRVEVFATRSHVDYHDEAAAAALGGWLREVGLTTNSVHAPIAEFLRNGQWGPSFSLAAADDAQRLRAVAETTTALAFAERLGAPTLVVHVGVPAAQEGPADNAPDAARRSIEELHQLARRSGTRLALEVIPNPLSSASALVRLIEDTLELPDVGICLDFGHAFIMGDVVDAIETASGHMIATHVHDNQGARDDHLVPFEGRIDWAAALMAVQKVGYDGPLMFEVANTATPTGILERTRAARERFQRLLATGSFEELTIEE
jgi:sugar phosphate isomerase/epimerase